MDCVDTLSQQGWYISSEGLKTVNENGNIKDLKAVIRNLLDADLREIYSPILATEITKNKINQVIVQVQKVRNISAPKINEESNVAPRMLKLIITDGNFSCQAIEVEHISGLSLDRTLPGTKLLLKGCDVVSACILLTPSTCTILGGKVAAMLEKWAITKSLLKHNRGSGRGGVDGPPTWVNFGTKIECSGAVAGNQPFKSLQVKEKEKKENEEFEVQRQDAIAEAATGAIKKVFGGGVKQQGTSQAYNYQQQQQQQFEQGYGGGKQQQQQTMQPNNSFAANNGRPPRQERRGKHPRENKDRLETEKSQKPADKISLFAFLEDKLPTVAEKTADYASSAAAPFADNQRQNYGHVNGYYNSESNHRNYGQQNYRNTTANSSERGAKFDYSNRKSNTQSSYANDYKQFNYNRNKSDTGSFPASRNPERPAAGGYSHEEAFGGPQDRGGRTAERAPRFQKTDSHSYFSDNAKFDFPKPTKFTAPSNAAVIDSVMNSMDRMSLAANAPDTGAGNFARNTLRQHLNFTSSASANAATAAAGRDAATFRSAAAAARNGAANAPRTQHQQQSQGGGGGGGRDTDFSDGGGEYVWTVGDRCMAKYWEDHKYYNAIVTAITIRTCVVQFLDYGNYEEVLKTDCIPITEEPKEPEKPNYKKSNYYQNNQFSGNVEFRQNKSRPYVKHNFQH